MWAHSLQGAQLSGLDRAEVAPLRKRHVVLSLVKDNRKVGESGSEGAQGSWKERGWSAEARPSRESLATDNKRETGFSKAGARRRHRSLYLCTSWPSFQLPAEPNQWREDSTAGSASQNHTSGRRHGACSLRPFCILTFFLPLFRSQVGVSACPGQEQAGYLNLGLKITAPQY